MAKLDDVTFVKEALRALVKVMRTTYDTLSQAIHQPDRQPPPEQVRRLSPTLDHIGHVREGFILSQRVSRRSQKAELRYMTQRVLFDWQWLEELGLSLESEAEIVQLGSQLIAYQHTLTVLGMVPRLPPEVITFPQPRPTYADVTVPRFPSQMLDRIEEIERTLYRATLMPLDDLAFDAVRRTYAFFEASAWVVNQHLAGLLAD
jgi:hypothetical protein